MGIIYILKWRWNIVCIITGIIYYCWALQSGICTFIIRGQHADSRYQFFGLHSQLQGRIREWGRGVGAVGGWRRSVAPDLYTHSVYNWNFNAELWELAILHFLFLTRHLLQTDWLLSALCGRSKDDRWENTLILSYQWTGKGVRYSCNSNTGSSQSQRKVMELHFPEDHQL